MSHPPSSCSLPLFLSFLLGWFSAVNICLKNEQQQQTSSFSLQYISRLLFSVLFHQDKIRLNRGLDPSLPGQFYTPSNRMSAQLGYCWGNAKRLGCCGPNWAGPGSTELCWSPSNSESRGGTCHSRPSSGHAAGSAMAERGQPLQPTTLAPRLLRERRNCG